MRNYFELEIWIHDQMKIKFRENHKIIKQKKTNPVSVKVNSQHRLPCIETFLWEKKSDIKIFSQQLELWILISGLSLWFLIPWLFIRHTDWQQINMQTERRHGQREFWFLIPKNNKKEPTWVVFPWLLKVNLSDRSMLPAWNHEGGKDDDQDEEEDQEETETEEDENENEESDLRPKDLDTRVTISHTFQVNLGFQKRISSRSSFVKSQKCKKESFVDCDDCDCDDWRKELAIETKNQLSRIFATDWNSLLAEYWKTSFVCLLFVLKGIRELNVCLL